MPITAGNLERLTPPPQSVEAVAAHFRDAGFTLLGKPGIRIAIAGPKKLFEGHFGIRLAQRADGAYEVHRKRGRGAKRGAAVPAADPTSIPADNLPPAIRRAVSQIALEVAMSIDQPRADP